MTAEGRTAGGEIAEALFTKAQRKVLGILFGNPGRSFYANEIISLAKTGTGAVQRELKRLAGAGLLTVTRTGNQKHYQANANSPVFEELRGIILKTSGLADVVRAALAPFGEEIEAAFVFGSVARGADTVSSDIDLMVISDGLTYAELFPTLEEAGEILGRKINPAVYSRAKLEERLSHGNVFAKRVMEQPRLWIAGGPDDLPS